MPNRRTLQPSSMLDTKVVSTPVMVRNEVISFIDALELSMI